MKKYTITGAGLTVEQLTTMVNEINAQVVLSRQAEERVVASRQLLEHEVADGRVIYGVNTGMGGFVDRLVPLNHAEDLQKNLLRSVATNVGDYIPREVVRASMLARINSLAQGNSAITLENLEKLIQMFNKGIIPCVPAKGSLGTSGDLGPLACIALVGIGEWKADVDGVRMSGAEALATCGLKPMSLSYKEGLALINGTSAMTGFAALMVADALHLFEKYILVSALSIEGLRGNVKPFNPIVHAKKPHPGQLIIAEKLFGLLRESKMICNEDTNESVLRKETANEVTKGSRPIEDAYSIRCTPQILGPVLDNLLQIKKTIEIELNSSNDNPLVIPEQYDVFHNGHFHGQYIAMAMDQLALSLSTLSNLADRRIDRFLDARNSNGLPPFLCSDAEGLRFGFMGGQFMTCSLTSENRALATPISNQSLPSTADFQDIVSLGFVAARRTKEILENTKFIIAFELLCGAQAADLRGKDSLAKQTYNLYKEVRDIVPFLEQDVSLSEFITKIKEILL